MVALAIGVIYPVLLRANGLNPLAYFRGAWPTIQLAFVSRSSVGTMAVTEQVTVKNLGVPQEYASFAVPLGSTIVAKREGILDVDRYRSASAAGLLADDEPAKETVAA